MLRAISHYRRGDEIRRRRATRHQSGGRGAAAGRRRIRRAQATPAWAGCLGRAMPEEGMRYRGCPRLTLSSPRTNPARWQRRHFSAALTFTSARPASISSNIRGSATASGRRGRSLTQLPPPALARQDRVRPEDHCSRDFSRNPLYFAPYQMLIAVKLWTVA